MWCIIVPSVAVFTLIATITFYYVWLTMTMFVTSSVIVNIMLINVYYTCILKTSHYHSHKQSSLSSLSSLLMTIKNNPIGSMCGIYGNIYHQYTPFMLAYIPAPWILWEWSASTIIKQVLNDQILHLKKKKRTAQLTRLVCGACAFRSPQTPRLLRHHVLPHRSSPAGLGFLSQAAPGGTKISPFSSWKEAMGRWGSAISRSHQLGL